MPRIILNGVRKDVVMGFSALLIVLNAIITIATYVKFSQDWKSTIFGVRVSDGGAAMENSTWTFKNNVTVATTENSIMTGAKKKNLTAVATGLAEGVTKDEDANRNPLYFSSEVLIYITTVFSDEHQRYLRCCWPQLLSQSRLFKNAHFMIFSNNVTTVDETLLAEIRDMFLDNNVKSFEFKFADGTPELELYMELILKEEKRGGRREWGHAMQYGATMAMSIGFSVGWFQPFDWIVRVNPDVLIRQSDFLVDNVDDPFIDAVILWCNPKEIHTDFFAVRPKAVAPDAFSNITVFHAETTATNEFKRIIEARRYIVVPDVQPSRRFCRIRGPTAAVYHVHDSKLCSSGFVVFEFF
jgi:hypothetical protein